MEDVSPLYETRKDLLVTYDKNEAMIISDTAQIGFAFPGGFFIPGIGNPEISFPGFPGAWK